MKLSLASCTLQLLNHLCTVHPIFHVSELEPATLNTITNWVQSPPPPIEVDKDIEYKNSTNKENVNFCTLAYRQDMKAPTKK